MPFLHKNDQKRSTKCTIKSIVYNKFVAIRVNCKQITQFSAHFVILNIA